MLCYAHDFDLYRAWAQLMVDGTFEPPVRRWSTATVYLRGQGSGVIRAVHGLDRLPAAVSDLVVDSRLPRPGQPSSGSYEGDGYITVRHPGTAAVTAAVKQILAAVRVELGALCESSRYAKEHAVVAGLSPAPIARAGPKGLHSRAGYA